MCLMYKFDQLALDTRSSKLDINSSIERKIHYYNLANATDKAIFLTFVVCAKNSTANDRNDN